MKNIFKTYTDYKVLVPDINVTKIEEEKLPWVADVCAKPKCGNK